jgi:HNH endonuclease
MRELNPEDPRNYDDVPESEWPGDWSRAIDGPDRRKYVVLRAKFREQCAATINPDGTVGALCEIDGCSDPAIDYGLKHPHPRAWELNHKIPVVKAPELALDPDNFEASHAICNRRLQAAGHAGSGLEFDGVPVLPDQPVGVAGAAGFAFDELVERFIGHRVSLCG